MFSFKLLVFIWRGEGFILKLDVQGKWVEIFWTKMDKGWGGAGGLENWTVFMDVIYVSPLTRINSF